MHKFIERKGVMVGVGWYNLMVMWGDWRRIPGWDPRENDTRSGKSRLEDTGTSSSCGREENILVK